MSRNKKLMFVLLGFCAMFNAGGAGNSNDMGNCVNQERSIEVAVGSSMSSQKYFHLANDKFEYVIKEPSVDASSGRIHFDIAKRGARRLSPDLCNSVWRKIGDLDIQKWRKKYLPSDLGSEISDGLEWNVRLQAGKTVLESCGVSAFPTKAQPDKTVLLYEGTNAFDVLVEILSELE